MLILIPVRWSKWQPKLNKTLHQHWALQLCWHYWQPWWIGEFFSMNFSDEFPMEGNMKFLRILPYLQLFPVCWSLSEYRWHPDLKGETICLNTLWIHEIKIFSHFVLFYPYFVWHALFWDINLNLRSISRSKYIQLKIYQFLSPETNLCTELNWMQMQWNKVILPKL